MNKMKMLSAVLLVTDYRGSGQMIEIEVKGVSCAPEKVTATVLDDTRDNLPCEVSWRNGRLSLVKPDKNSAAFLARFHN